MPHSTRSHCVHGHELTPENTYTRNDSRAPGCRECRRISLRRFKARNTGRQILPMADGDVSRFWEHVDRSGGDDACWPFRGAPNSSGYCYFYVNGSNRGAHVVAFAIASGPTPDGHEVCHTCDNPPCCNPAHLYSGTRFTNMQDCAAKGRNGSQRHPERRPRGDEHWTRKRAT